MARPRRQHPRPHWGGLLGALLVAGQLMGIPAPTLAEPAGDWVTPAPATCRVDPLSADDILDIAGAATPEPPVVIPADEVDALPVAPEGPPAEDETAAAVIRTVREATACDNGFDLARLWALYTDDGLARLLARLPPLRAADLGDLEARPDLRPEGTWRAVRVDEVRQLPRGRAVALVLAGFPNATDDDLPIPGGLTTLAYTLAPDPRGDRWLLERIEPLGPSFPEAVGGDEYAGAILPPADASDLADPRDYDGYWAPTPRDVAALEAGLERYLRRTAPDLADDLSGYGRQYAGVARGDELAIVASFLCDDDFGALLRGPVIVSDGGDCFFRVTYDLETETYRDLSINGEA